MKNIQNRYLIKILSIALFCILGLLSSASGQGWSRTFSTFSGGGNVRNDVVHIPEYTNGKTFPVSLYRSDNDHSFLFSNTTGENWGGFGSSAFSPSGPLSSDVYTPESSVMLGLDSTIVLSTVSNPAGDGSDIYLSCYKTDSFITTVPTELVWNESIFDDPMNNATAAALQLTFDGNLIALGSVRSEPMPSGLMGNELVLVKSNINGQVQWTKILASPGNDVAVQIIQAPDGGYWILKNTQPELTSSTILMWLLKIDANGELEWEVNIGTDDNGYDMITTADGNLAITGTNFYQTLFVLKIDEFGFPLWRQDYYPYNDRIMLGRGIIEDQQNHLVVAGRGTFYSGQEQEEDGFIVKLTQNGTPLWERKLGVSGREDGFNDIALTPNGDYLMGGFRAFLDAPESFHAWMTKSDTFGIVKSGLIHGNIFHDLDLDCMPIANEMNLANWNVQITSDSLTYFGNTDDNGNYSIPVSVASGTTVDYTVSVISPSAYWVSCNNDFTVTLSYLDTANVDFSMQGLINCPFMEAQINSTSYRPCDTTNIYINYCNTGTVTAEDASVEVLLDPNLIYTSATITPSVVDGQLYTFPLGDVAVNECGTVVIMAIVDCNSPDSIGIDDVLCIEASLYPDTICSPPNSAWSGALLQLSYTCDNDSVFYSIENIGTDEMAAPLDYIIIEDAVLLFEGDIDNLEPAEVELSEGLPLDGPTYHLIAEQEPGAPGPNWISLGTMGCDLGNSSNLTEFVQFAGGPFDHIYCNTVIGSYDPNDKQANPSGFGEENYILPNTDIDYTIRFQNTGTDTAFRVVILDTLSTVLDPASVVLGPYSHPYEFRLLDQGVLSFTFHDIELPDSTTNLAESQGFISYKIKQQPNLETGTLIENSAAIYFDFNAPIITNTAFHTVNQLIEIEISDVNNTSLPELEVDIFPNPMEDRAWVQIKGVEVEEMVTLHLFDVNGRLIKEIEGGGNGLWLDRKGLVSGIYFFTLNAKELRLASGKLVVE